MSINKKTLIFCASTYTIPFIQTEIVFLAKNFKKVIIVCEEKSNLPLLTNVVIKQISYSNYKTLKQITANFFSFFSILFLELFSHPIYFFYPKLLKKIASNLLRSFYLKDELKKIISKEDSLPILYSFWFNNWATALSLLKKEKGIEKYYSRVHGTDLYEERVPVTKKIPFRKLQLKYVTKVFSVSKQGELYLKNKYPKHQSKIYTYYLGTNFGGTNPYNPNNIFTIVSCARVRNIKRIYLIAEILLQIDFPLKWIHVGDENLQSNDSTMPLYIKNKNKLKNKTNIQTEFKGNLTNEQVFNLYQTNSINLFVSVSETEGIPVSMMEAISFGIPILSTNVGGCSEIVTKQIGILIPKNFSSKEVAQIISNFKNSEINTNKFRFNVQKNWQQYFDNNTNGTKFITALLE